MTPAVMPPGTATTQPMAIPRTGMTGLKPSRPGAAQTTRSTERIVLPIPPGSRPNSTKALSAIPTNGRINLPIGMILRCLPPEVLAADMSEFEASGAAATEIGLPMNMILGQLPSGKVEMPFQDLIPHFPPGYLQPTQSIASYLPSIISLPLMDVVMRIPPDLLALRPDQKDVDASVINMADPFTEEILREQAEAARRQSQTNIIEESQVPHEEFVPRDQLASAKTVAPPRRTLIEPPAPVRTPTVSILPSSGPSSARLPMPPATTIPRAIPLTPSPATLLPPSIPASTSRSLSASGRIPLPSRSTTSLPVRSQGPATTQIELPSSAMAPVPPVPRRTGPIPAPPPPRHTTSLPTVRARTGSIPSPSQAAFVPAPMPVAVAEEPAVAPLPGPPNPGTDDLQRLAAMAMAQLGETEEAPPSEAPAESAPAPTAAMADETVELAAAAASGAALLSVAAPAQVEETVPTPEPIRAPAAEPIRAPAPEPAAASADENPAVAGAEANGAAPAVAFNLNTCTADDLVKNIDGCSEELAQSIVHYRTKIGSFKRLEELLDVPGITRAAYTNLTGEAPPNAPAALSLNDLLGFSKDQQVSLKEVTERISCWPDVTGCVLSQSSGLSLVGTAPEGVDKAAIVAFAPRMFESINKSFSEVSGQETDALLIPSAGTSYHLLRSGDLYLIIMSRLPQMPERHLKVARLVLAALSTRKD